MKSLYRIAVTLVAVPASYLCFMAPGSAQAQNARALDVRAARVIEHWTADRRAAATPRDLVIDELEPESRGVYAGAAGYLGFNGNLDLAIAIRTGIVKDGKLHVQAAAGIVADSIPENEWRETQNKARALLAAAEQVHAGLDLPLA